MAREGTINKDWQEFARMVKQNKDDVELFLDKYHNSISPVDAAKHEGMVMVYCLVLYWIREFSGQ